MTASDLEKVAEVVEEPLAMRRTLQKTAHSGECIWDVLVLDGWARLSAIFDVAIDIREVVAAVEWATTFQEVSQVGSVTGIQGYEDRIVNERQLWRRDLSSLSEWQVGGAVGEGHFEVLEKQEAV